MAKRYELTDQQWTRIADMLPGKKSDPGRTAKDNRLFVSGVLWVLRSGAQWDELPERYGKWKSVHKRIKGDCRPNGPNSISIQNPRRQAAVTDVPAGTLALVRTPLALRCSKKQARFTH
jgi:transposase